MLGSMSPDLQRKFENYSLYDMLQELKSMFEKQAEVERTPQLCPQDISIGLILYGLINDLVGFVRNYNMHNIWKIIGELHALIIKHEKGLSKNDATPQVLVIQSVSKNDVLYFNAIPRDGIYEINMLNLVSNVNSIYNVSNRRAKHNLDSTYLWHYHLAHISNKRIEKLQRDGLLKSTNSKSFDRCVCCLSGKMTRKPFPHQTKRATNLLGLIHTDVCGPLRYVSRQGASYFITFMDDFSSYGYVYLVKHKHEVFETFKDAQMKQSVTTSTSHLKTRLALQAAFILGIKIYRDRSKRSVGLSQSDYIDKILKKIRMDGSKCGNISMQERLDLNKTERAPTPEENPGEDHWIVVKNILKYLRNTKDMFLVYGGNLEAELRVTCYCDAGFETDRDDINS
uniref:Retrotransposon protein, putative, Ty1-copia subclass n=1 Tax=Tanacetum cinerariifolium TaxID=118510 RepID=A0A699ITU4_TANCI|nr:retrotransposon protein, putative, Ty1-copia subclass [Tanacetum cinerariifolium]